MSITTGSGGPFVAPPAVYPSGGGSSAPGGGGVPVIFSSPIVNVAPPSGDISGITDGLAISTATAQLPGGKGVLQFQNGNYFDNQSRDYHNSRNVTWRGAGGVGGGGVTATVVQYTGTAARYIDARSSFGFQLQDIMLVANNVSFAGNLVDLSHAVSGSIFDSAYWRLERCFLGSVATTGVIVFLDQAISGTIYGCTILKGSIGVQGIATAGHYANQIGILCNSFSGQGSAAISGIGQGWAVIGNDVELGNGNSALAEGPTAGGGWSYIGNWIGDTTGSPAILRIFGNGVSIRGNFIGGTATSKAIQFTGTSDGIEIAGNWLSVHSLGIDKNTQAVSNITLGPNSYGSVTTHHNFVAGGTLYIEP